MKIAQSIGIAYMRYKLYLLRVLSAERAGKEMFRLFTSPNDRPKNYLPSAFDKGEQLSFLIDGLKVHGFRMNTGGEQKVLIVHGYTSHTRNFEQYVDPLVNKGFEVIAFDAPAHGMSDGKQINGLLYASMIKKINELYGPINHFIGHSLGGLALALALEDIKHTCANKLVLIAPATETRTAVNVAFKTLKIKSEKMKNLLHNEIKRVGGKDVDWYSVRRAIKTISAKTLWIHDEDDSITPLEDALRVAKENPQNVEFLFTQKLGHQQIFRTSLIVDKTVEFLASPHL